MDYNKHSVPVDSAVVEVYECVDHGIGFPQWIACEPMIGEIAEIDSPKIMEDASIGVVIDGEFSWFRSRAIEPLTALSRALLKIAKEKAMSANRNLPDGFVEVTQDEFFALLKAQDADVMPSQANREWTTWETPHREVWGWSTPGWANPGAPKMYAVREQTARGGR